MEIEFFDVCHRNIRNKSDCSSLGSRTPAMMYRLLFRMLTWGNSENRSATKELSDEGLVLETVEIWPLSTC